MVSEMCQAFPWPLSRVLHESQIGRENKKKSELRAQYQATYLYAGYLPIAPSYIDFVVHYFIGASLNNMVGLAGTHRLLCAERTVDWLH
jgi:hypothetical protein